MVDKEKLLAEARRRYPIGTEAESLYSKKFKVPENSTFRYWDSSNEVSVKDTLGFDRVVYRDSTKEWAKIITPVVKSYRIW